MSGDTERAAWADYWTSAGGARPACLPNAGSGVEAAQRGVWAAFANALPRRAKVLDIGTGDGAVLAALSTGRRDLELTGVDNAPALPRSPKGMRLMADVAAERLPFPDRRFDAVVSQFGFEYADSAKAAAEVARVLRAGGAVQMVVHHRGGPIVAHNGIRRRALGWALDDIGLLERARALVAARRVAALPTPDAFRAAIREAQLRFGPGSGAEELAEAIWRTLEGGRMRPAAEAATMLDTLERRGRAETVRIDALLKAARDEGEIAMLAADLEAVGLSLPSPQPLFEQHIERPFAWRIDGRKPGAGSGR